MTELEKKICESVTQDFERRREERRKTESGWILGMNFVAGNQYCDVMPSGEVEEDVLSVKKKAFNYIAPMVETRMSKLKRMRTSLKVRAFSDEESDLKIAMLSNDILSNATERIRLNALVDEATVWSETCGTAFYGVFWNNEGGKVIGIADKKPLYEGEIEVEIIPPFELYPDSPIIASIEQQPSLIRARVVSVRSVKEKYGVELVGKDSAEFGTIPLVSGMRASCGLHDCVLLLERYTLPTGDEPDGKLEIVADDTLLYEGALPFVNGEYGRRGYPFIKQVCMPIAGSFFGASVVERLIPLQRSYNAVRNRKQEFLNRLPLGVVTVEDGSVDTDELAEDGLAPGKILVYRQGSEPPKYLDCGDVPEEFEKEEDRLTDEFVKISGMNDVSGSYAYPSGVTSATGLQLLIDRDDAKLTQTAGEIRECMQKIGTHILRLYKQFAGEKRLVRMTGEGKKVKLAYFSSSDLTADDIIFEEGEELNGSTRKNLVLDLMDRGLLSDGEGKLSVDSKNRILDAIGCGSFENMSDLTSLQRNRAREENLGERALVLSEYDDDEVHVAEHVRFLLSDSGGREAEMTRHIICHKKRLEEKNGRREQDTANP
ncbi:MAG: hypothetical protein J5993_01485 [Clostridia bacterium]|nr:hypothetical protein [Clostridia bacterium]